MTSLCEIGTIPRLLTLKKPMIWAVKRKNENNERLMRRFKKQTQRAGIVRKTRRSKYHVKSKTKRRVRDEAVMRTVYRARKIERILWN